MLGKNIHFFISFSVALMKAFIAGAVLGLAVSGLMELAFAIAAPNTLTVFWEEYSFDVFGWGGGLVGTALQLFSRI